MQTADMGQSDFADFKIGRVKSKKNSALHTTPSLSVWIKREHGMARYGIYPGQIETNLIEYWGSYHVNIMIYDPPY